MLQQEAGLDKIMISQTEYEQRYANRIYGKRRGRVIDNKDPERLGRVKVENIELFGANQSTWALPSFPFYGGRDSGFFAVPPIGTLVWLEFEEGLIDYPIYTGGFWEPINDGHRSDGSPIESERDYQQDTSPIPPHARGVYDGSDFAGLKGATGVPETTFEGSYGDVIILQSPAGHLIELDDTEGGKRIQIHHAKGAHIEILDDGSINIISGARILTRSNHREEVVLDADVKKVGGASTHSVDGDFSKSVGGSTSFSSVGSVEYSSSNVSATTGAFGLESSSITANILNAFTVDAGGGVDVSCFGDFSVVSAAKGFMSFSNALSVPEPIFQTEALVLTATNGTTKLVSTDPTQQVSAYGVECRGGSAAQVMLGNLTPALRASLMGVGPIPLTKEPLVMGLQLKLFLEAVMSSLETFYSIMSTGGATPGFGGPNPVLATASVSALTALQAAHATFLTIPSPTQSLILSESVFLSKV